MSLKSNSGPRPSGASVVRGAQALGTLGAVLLLSLSAAAAGQEKAGAVGVVERRLSAMGTWLDLHVEAGSRAEALRASEAGVRAVEAVEERLSTWKSDSELARLNAHPVGEPFELSAELAADLACARRLHELTGGAFDPSIGGLVEAWGLRTGGRKPSEVERLAAMVDGGFRALALEGGIARRTLAKLRVEEGGFGKGSGLDAALKALAAAGATRASVDLGGQVAVLGARGRPFEWRIAHPRERARPLLSLRLESGSLSTSGNSEHGIVVDGVRHGHLLDPRTGLPARDFGSVSVVAADGFTADALSTALFVLGPEAGLAWAASHPEVEVLWIELDAAGALRARVTPGLAPRLAPLEAGLVLEIVPAPRAPSAPGALSPSED